MLGDILKGFLAVKLAVLLGDDPQALMRLAALGAFIGHCYPVWLKFNGGKGIATLLGIALAFHWIYLVTFAAAWLGLFALFRYSSLGGIGAAVALPVAALLRGDPLNFFLFTALAGIAIWKHRGNIGRLLRGEEPRVGARKRG